MKKFSSPDGMTLCIIDNVWERFVQYQKEGDFTLENGGILIGILNPADNQVVITDHTEAAETDKRSRFHFFRSQNLHQQIMDELWETSGYLKTYLGEWHTHDEDIPKPSVIDTHQWKKINRRNHNSKNLFYVILGKKEIKVWTIVDGNIMVVEEGEKWHS